MNNPIPRRSFIKRTSALAVGIFATTLFSGLAHASDASTSKPCKLVKDEGPRGECKSRVDTEFYPGSTGYVIHGCYMHCEPSNTTPGSEPWGAGSFLAWCNNDNEPVNNSWYSATKGCANPVIYP